MAYRYTAKNQAKKENCLVSDGFWVRELRHSENVSDEKRVCHDERNTST